MTPRRCRGFVLVEVLVVLIVSSILVVALLGGLIAIVHSLQPATVLLNDKVVPIAPSFGAFPSALRLHEAFSDSLASARAVYVLGGRHISIPNDAPAASLGPLRLQSLPAFTDFSPGLPMDAKTFYDMYSDTLGAIEAAPAADDFSVVVVGPANGVLAITCLVQVRRSDITVSDGADFTSYTMREVNLWQWGSDQPLRYAFAERPSQAGSLFVGAVHTWLRFEPDTAQQEEGPACVVFPDPWAYTGARGQADDLPAFSRFTYFLPVSS